MSKTQKEEKVAQSLLKFSVGGNAKLAADITTFSLPSGFSCPGALECLAKANSDTGKIRDGAQQKFRCFSASQEATYRTVREQRWHNFLLLRASSKDAMRDLIQASLPKKSKIVRIHVGGDFFNQAYFDAWLEVATANPQILFYAYTKSVHFWVERFAEIPANLHLNASRGGKYDHLIDRMQLKTAEVVFSPEEAKAKGLDIDHDDTHAYRGNKSFALLLHGVQPTATLASAALKALRDKNVKYAYARE